MTYGLRVELAVIMTAGGSLLDQADQLTAELAKLDHCTKEFLDFAVSADAGASTLEIDLTIEADSLVEAVNIADSIVRTGVHAIGGGTPGWEKGPRFVGDEATYTLAEAKARPVGVI